MPRWSRTLRTVAWVALASLLPTPAAEASHLREVPWEKVGALKPGERLWVDLAGGERRALRLVRADERRLVALDLPADWGESVVREACRRLARSPELATLAAGRGSERRSLDVGSARLDLAREAVVAVTLVRPGSGRRGAALALGAVTLFNVLLLGVAAAYAE